MTRSPIQVQLRTIQSGNGFRNKRETIAPIGKLFFCPLVEDIADFGLELDEMGGQFALPEKGAGDSPPASHRRWLRLAYQARGTAIAGGSTFIQRNIIAERMLGMPKG